MSSLADSITNVTTAVNFFMGGLTGLANGILAMPTDSLSFFATLNSLHNLLPLWRHQIDFPSLDSFSLSLSTAFYFGSTPEQQHNSLIDKKGRKCQINKCLAIKESAMPNISFAEKESIPTNSNGFCRLFSLGTQFWGLLNKSLDREQFATFQTWPNISRFSESITLNKHVFIINHCSISM